MSNKKLPIGTGISQIPAIEIILVNHSEIIPCRDPLPCFWDKIKYSELTGLSLTQ